MRAALTGESDADAEARGAARGAGRARARSDRTRSTCSRPSAATCTKLRYADWDELMDYCRYSAMPVGRFVLDVHGEDRATWPANDALCAALQVINHLQDCAKDYRELDRVYLPHDVLAAHGARVEMLARRQALAGAARGRSPTLAARTRALLDALAPVRRRRSATGAWRSRSA